MGGNYSTYSNESEQDAMNKMFQLLADDGHAVQFSKKKKKFFIVREGRQEYITVEKRVNIYEEVSYACLLREQSYNE
jgi:hypothetical protein